MAKEWQILTGMTGGEDILIERVKVLSNEIAIEGEFELPPLARLKSEDQIFAAAFLRCHGSIKQMEQLFGVSYPTIKSRLNKISEQLDCVKIEARPELNEILDSLNKGEIDVNEALKKLKND